MKKALGPSLPFIRRLFDSPPTTTAPPTSPAATGVLVIDPDEAVRTAFSGWLLRQGFTVWTAADQDEALTVYRQHGSTITLVVEDLRTYWVGPRSHGPKCERLSREQSRGSACPLAADLSDNAVFVS